MSDDRAGNHPLTASERRRLNELDEWFQLHDPGLATLLARGPLPHAGRDVFLVLVTVVMIGPLMVLSLLLVCGVGALMVLAVGALASTVALWSRVRRPGPHRHDPG